MYATSVKVDVECTNDPSRFLALPSAVTARGAARLKLWSCLSPVQQAVLGCDGSFTLLLSALLGQEVKVALIEQTIDHLEQYDEAIDLGKGDRVLNRDVRLYIEPDSNIVYASSVIAIDRIQGPLAADLLGGKETIGRLLRKHRLETFRELVDWGSAPVPVPGKRYFAGSEMMYRSYRVYHHSVPVMLITEFFDHRVF